MMLFGEAEEVWPCWRTCHWTEALGVLRCVPFRVSSLCFMFAVQDMASQPLLQVPCLPAARLPRHDDDELLDVQITPSFYKVALVVMFYHSDGKVTKAPGNQLLIRGSLT